MNHWNREFKQVDLIIFKLPDYMNRIDSMASIHLSSNRHIKYTLDLENPEEKVITMTPNQVWARAPEGIRFPEEDYNVNNSEDHVASDAAPSESGTEEDR